MDLSDMTAVSIDIKADSVGRTQIGFATYSLDHDSTDRMFLYTKIDYTTEWETVVIPLSDFTIFDPDNSGLGWSDFNQKIEMFSINFERDINSSLTVSIDNIIFKGVKH